MLRNGLVLLLAINFISSFAKARTCTYSPSLTGITPSSARVGDVVLFTITGSKFCSRVSVTFDGIAAKLSFTNRNMIKGTVPPHGAGSVSVTVSNPNGKSAAIAFNYTAQVSSPPTPTFTPTPSPSLSPSQTPTPPVLVPSPSSSPLIPSSLGPTLPGGKFAFVYPNFTGAANAMGPHEFVEVFAGAMHNPNVFQNWVQSNTDLRQLNSNGAYLKHINLRTIDLTQPEPSVEGHPDFRWIQENHPEWIVKDVNGKPIPLFLSTEQILDFGNDAYLDWVLNTWMPNRFFDGIDSDPGRVTWYLQDNGDFNAMNIQCAENDPVCKRYTTAEGVQSAWTHLLDRFKSRWPSKRILVNTGVLTYKTPVDQLAMFTRVLSHSDGYFSECLVDTHCYWKSEANASKRTALTTQIQLASWLGDNNLLFFPNFGMYNGAAPTQSETDYAWAYFNLLRKGEHQVFSKVTKDTSGYWQPHRYPEMDLALGEAIEPATLISPNVYRRAFDQAIVYVNLSDAAIVVSLPAGGIFYTSSGKILDSTITIGSFGGLTVYRR